MEQSKAWKLLDRLCNDEHAVWAFLQDPHGGAPPPIMKTSLFGHMFSVFLLVFRRNQQVLFDNHQAERDLPMVKVQQNVSGSFRAEADAAAFARICGSLSILRTQGLPLLSAFQATLQALPILPVFH